MQSAHKHNPDKILQCETFVKHLTMNRIINLAPKECANLQVLTNKGYYCHMNVINAAEKTVYILSNSRNITILSEM